MNGRGAQRRIVMPGRTRDALGTMLLGILLWLLPAVVMLAIPAFGGPITIPAQPTDAALIWLLLLTAVFFGEALPEELVFRGHVQTVLLEKLGQWPAIIIQALVFALFGMALGGWRGWLDLSLLLTMGLVFGYLRMRFKSIWFGIGFHTAFQFGAQAILTHGLLETAASPQLVQVAIGAVPFTVAVMAGVWRKSA
ncbi:MAG: lysostaphin resistance A-like protein [Gulosibacter sp.]|uniref:CPBP family intramembrane glutamic endopeptidase n=1 Tax=Gulosibacter sp. TaxID=2817531 RepID=UPI003F8DD09A